MSVPLTEERIASPDNLRAQLKFAERENKIVWGITNDFMTDEHPDVSEKFKFEIAPLAASHMLTKTRDFVHPSIEEMWRYKKWLKWKTSMLKPETLEEVRAVLSKKMGVDL